MAIKVGILGTGGMANYHAESFRKLKGVRLASCFDVVADKARAFAERHGVERVAESAQQLCEQVDAVAVVTPDRFHREGALAALESGRHLLCEKPLTTTLEEARQVAQAYKRASKRGVIGMVNFSYRRSAALQKAIAMAKRGELGELRHAHGSYLQCWVAAPVWGHWSTDTWLWRLQTASGSGGVLGDIGCHLLDLATALTGQVKRARCLLATFPKIGKDGKAITSYGGKKLDANDTAVIELLLENGATVVLHMTRWAVGHQNQIRLEVHGTSGALEFDLDRSYDQLNLCAGKDVANAQWKTLELKATPNNWERFIRAIKTKKADQPDILRGAQVQAYLDGCERSAKSGRWEDIKPWE